MERSFYVVGIGASAGGLKALQEFFEHMPENPNAGFIVVTHILRDYRTQLDYLLSKSTCLPVSRIAGGETVRRNHVYVMPENVTATIREGKLLLEERKDHGANRSVDKFFVSLAEDQGTRAIAVILSGGGTDGLTGIQRIHEMGGRVYVQEPASSAFSMMPWTAINYDAPDVIKTPAGLAQEVAKNIGV